MGHFGGLKLLVLGKIFPLKNGILNYLNSLFSLGPFLLYIFFLG